MTETAEAIHRLYPWISVERALDLLDEAGGSLAPMSTISERARFTIAKIMCLWGPP